MSHPIKNRRGGSIENSRGSRFFSSILSILPKSFIQYTKMVYIYIYTVVSISTRKKTWGEIYMLSLYFLSISQGDPIKSIYYWKKDRHELLYNPLSINVLCIFTPKKKKPASRFLLLLFKFYSWHFDIYSHRFVYKLMDFSIYDGLSSIQIFRQEDFRTVSFDDDVVCGVTMRGNLILKWIHIHTRTMSYQKRTIG